jgi:hypothetical protein
LDAGWFFIATTQTAIKIAISNAIRLITTLATEVVYLDPHLPLLIEAEFEQRLHLPSSMSSTKKPARQSHMPKSSSS